MKYNATIAGEMSGSIGGITASHNTFGVYLRKKVIPVNPHTAGQIVVRNFFGTLAALWQGLTQPQRDSFIVYGNNVIRSDSLGNPIKLSGLNWYQAINVLRLQGSLARIDTMASTFSMGPATAPTITALPSAGTTFSVGFSNNIITDPWANTVAGAMMVYMSAPFAPTRTFFNGPYRFAGKIPGAVVPPTSPALITKTYSIVAGQRVGFKFVALSPDGRISTPMFATALAT